MCFSPNNHSATPERTRLVRFNTPTGPLVIRGDAIVAVFKHPQALGSVCVATLGPDFNLQAELDDVIKQVWPNEFPIDPPDRPRLNITG